MNPDTSKPGQGPAIPPVSVFTGPIAELVGHRLLSPPARPGLLASLAHFEVTRVLGGGGMGVVVLARDSVTGKDVAIKLIRPELVSDQRVVHRFVKEAGHLQKLKHPNIVPVLEVSARPEGPYFVMPYFGLGSLAQRIHPGQPMEPDAALDLCLQVAEGLAFAHRHGIIHRDLKPANILLDDGGKSCLADFGLARTMFNDTIIDVGRDQFEGTAPYMSPGVAAGNAEDTRCDIYAFGALLYEMLTGEPPYAGSSTNDIRGQILAGPPKPILERNPAADSGLVTVAEGAMARELRDRYADMADVVADLERIKAGRTPVGPHDVVQRVKQMPFSLWIPTGIILITAGLWLLWPSAPPEKPTPSPAPQPSQIVVPTNPVVSNPPPPPRTSRQTNWQVSLLAGQPGIAGSADGAASEARFNSPGGIAVDAASNTYVADTGNNTIRKITPDGSVSTLAGQAGKTGDLDGQGTAARFTAPWGIAVDQSGNVYITEFATDVIRKINSDGYVSTLAGSFGNPGSEDGRGDDAHFRNPWSIAVGPTGNIYVADQGNYTIRQITPSGEVSTFAGRAGKKGNADGFGARALFGLLDGVTVDQLGMIYAADAGNGVVRQVFPTGQVFTWAGKAGAAIPNVRFSDVQEVALGGPGVVYVLDNGAVRLMNLTRSKTIVLTYKDGRPLHPSAMAAGAKGDLYLAEGTNNVVWKVTPPARFMMDLSAVPK